MYLQKKREKEEGPPHELTLVIQSQYCFGSRCKTAASNLYDREGEAKGEGEGARGEGKEKVKEGVRRVIDLEDETVHCRHRE